MPRPQVTWNWKKCQGWLTPPQPSPAPLRPCEPKKVPGMGNATPTITCTPQTMWTKKSARNGQRHPNHHLHPSDHVNQKKCQEWATPPLSLAAAATSIIFVAKVLSWQTCVCRDKSMLVETHMCLSWQNRSFVKHAFAMTKVISRQKYFVPTNTCLSWQNFCCDKNDTCSSSRQWRTPTSTPLDCTKPTRNFSSAPCHNLGSRETEKSGRNGY